MNKQQIHLNDWARILCGEVPASFYIELLIRALVVYLILMFAIRAMGKRMASQLSRNELAALVSLAAAVGVPMMSPNRGILPPIVIAVVVICIQRCIASRAVASQSFEKFSQGNISVLISDGVADFRILKRVGLSQAELFAQLRGQGIIHLGLVERFYMEANGAFTLVKSRQPKPGLAILPAQDKKYLAELQWAPDTIVCSTCGNLQTARTCTNCDHDVWEPATTD